MRPTPQVPTNWIWATLGEVLTGIEAGKSFKCDERPPTNGEVGVVKVSAVTWGTFDEHASKTCTEPERIDERFFIGPGDFLFSRANTIQLVGACVIVGGLSRRLMLSDKILRFRLKNVVPEWALYVLRSEWGRSEIERLATGNQESMRNIGQDRIRAIRIPLPPEAEQRRIVAEIESQFTRLDAATSSLRQVKFKLNRLRASVLHAACEGRIGTTRKSSWTHCLLADVIGEIRNGISVKPNAARGLRILRISAVRPLKADVGDVRFLPGISPEFESYLLRPGDLLFTRYNGNPDYVGVVGCLKKLAEPTVYPDKLIRVRLADTAPVLPEFLEIILNAGHAREFLRSRIRTTAGQSGISGRDLRLTPISLPDLPAQAQIIAEVQSRLSGADLVERTVDNNLKRAVRLRQSILKRAFEGRLVFQDPRDELLPIWLRHAARNGRPDVEEKG